MQDKFVLITGAAGSIGSELVRQLAAENQVYALDTNETDLFDLYEEMKLRGTPIKTRVGDIRNKDTIEDIFNAEMIPEVVIHAAAYKHVSPMELDPIEAVNTNIIGTYNLVRMAKRKGTRQFIFISTDKVVQAESIMGLTKKIAEQIVKNAGYVSVRFGNVLGSRGSVIPIWQKQIDNNLPLTVTDSRMTRYFMTIPEACKLVIEAVNIGEPGQKIILDMGDQVNVLELAKEVLKKSGKELDIKIIGSRPGESLTEELMTADEKAKAVKKGSFYVLS